MTKIKLCGLRTRQDILCVNELLPDYIGFVFFPKSKRYVTPEQAAELREHLDSRIIPTGVFVNAKISFITNLVNQHIIDAVQLHGTEDAAYIEKLRESTNCPIIQAFQIHTTEDIKKAQNSCADYILLDSGTGSGITFDHHLINGINRPYFLAGGLTPDNVSTLTRQFLPFAVDASSSLETNGYKDRQKMIAFVNAVRKKVYNYE